MTQKENKTVKVGKKQLQKKMIKPLDLQRDKLVTKVFMQSEKLEKQMIKFKLSVIDKVAKFMKSQGLSGNFEDFGNMTLGTLDGNMKLIFQSSEVIEFDEKLKVAKEKIDECLTLWSADSNDNIKALILNAFNVDKKGKLNKALILGLVKLNIKDKVWVEAMRLIMDSMQVVNNRRYVQLMWREDDAKQWERLNLNFSSM